MCSRPPRLSNQSTRRGALRARPAIARPARPADCLDARAQRAARREPGCWSGASLEVFVPCNARWRRSRCPGRPASGRSRFGVSSRRRPARPHFHADLPARMTCSRALAVFRSSGFPGDEARVADVFGRSVPIESVARTIGMGVPFPARLPCVAAGRRSVAPTPTSSIARAGETGETDPQRHPPAGTLAAGARHAVTLVRDPYHSSAFARTPPPDTGHSPKRAFFAWRSATRSSTALPGRATQVFPQFVARRRSWGSTRPFAGLLPLPGGHATLASRGGLAHTVVRPLDISAGPGPRAVRASASAPIDFRRGDRSPVGGNEICKSDRPGTRWHRLLGFALPSAVRLPGTRWSGETILPWALPLAGLSGTLPCIGSGLDPAADHQPPDAFDGQLSRRERVLSAHGLATLLPATRATRVRANCSRRSAVCRDCEGLSLRRFVVLYSVLMGLMPCST